MTLPVAFLRAARVEFVEAAAWYEAHGAGLGVEFIAEIQTCIRRAAEHPLTYAAVYRDARRVTAERFPYSVYFRAQAQRIVVLAVFHGSRDPAIWQRRT
ncbi:MAG: type II toxin-antitoxin system RelE/ParE family toxin [Nevskia sp.]|nr:type II toxin-antitoxin system RelE/ParE family toxin [Nevskia sp.]